MREIVAWFLLSLVTLAAAAQHHSSSSDVAESLHPGLGNYHYPITTRSPEAPASTRKWRATARRMTRTT